MGDAGFWAIVIGIVVALVGAIWALTRHGINRMEETLAEHSERIAKLETDNVSTKLELTRLRDMRHDIIEQVSHSLASWYTSLINQFKK